MAQKKFTFITDADLHREAAEVSKEMGITTSAAINMFLRAYVGTRSIPFEVRADYAVESPAERAEITRILEERSKEADDPNTQWLTGEEVKKIAGLD